MSNAPIRIVVEINDLQPTPRFQAAMDELADAARELLAEGEDVVGFGGTMGDEPAMIRTSQMVMSPTPQVWAFDGKRGSRSFWESLPADLQT